MDERTGKIQIETPVFTRVELPLDLPSRALLESYRPSEQMFLNPNLAHGSLHDMGHLAIVLIMQELITNKSLEENPTLTLNREALRWAASTHDVRKKRDYELNVRLHGENASKWIMDSFAISHNHIPRATLDLISFINYYHGYKKKELPQSYPTELTVIRDADKTDIMRIIPFTVPVIGQSPNFVRATLRKYLSSKLELPVTLKLFQWAEQIGIMSRTDADYLHDPFSVVMSSAQKIGAIAE